MNPFEIQAAPPIPVTIGGREYRLTPLRFRDHAEAARRMCQDWPRPQAIVRRLGRGLPSEERRALVELVYREERRGNQPELAEVLRWYRTPQGLVFHKWLMLRTHQPELTLADVDELLTQASLAEQSLSLGVSPEEANGLPAGNAFAPSQELPQPAAAGPAMTENAGQACSHTSPANMAGRPSK